MGMSESRRTTPEEARRVGDEIGVDWSIYALEEFWSGMDVEFEHGAHDPQTNVTNDDPIITGKIARPSEGVPGLLHPAGSNGGTRQTRVGGQTHQRLTAPLLELFPWIAVDQSSIGSW
jgi:hypothetical protein